LVAVTVIFPALVGCSLKTVVPCEPVFCVLAVMPAPDTLTDAPEIRLPWALFTVIVTDVATFFVIDAFDDVATSLAGRLSAWIGVYEPTFPSASLAATCQ